MKNIFLHQALLCFLVLTILICPLAIYPADVTGIWKAEFETQIGIQKYTFNFKQIGNQVNGTATSDIGGEKQVVTLSDVKMDGDTISFVEMLPFQGMDLRISYQGTVGTNEIKLTRNVGEFASEELVAKRVETSAPSDSVGQRPRLRFQSPTITLDPDDTPAFAAAPVGFDEKRQSITHGRIDSVEYDSKTVGTKRKMLIYTPPDYTTDYKYPVLYLLHGIGGDESEWYKYGAPNVILDNLYADKKIVPMLVVMPNGRAQQNDRAEGDVFRHSKAFETFEQDLLKDVIPFIEANFPVKTGRENRALAGLSMGGGQSLNFGLGHLDVFAWIGSFSAAPNTKAPEQLIPNPAETARELKLLWISCGDKDGLISISQGVHRYLKENNILHIWHVDSGGHDWQVWKNDLYLFSKRIFK